MSYKGCYSGCGIAVAAQVRPAVVEGKTTVDAAVSVAALVLLRRAENFCSDSVVPELVRTAAVEGKATGLFVVMANCEYRNG